MGRITIMGGDLPHGSEFYNNPGSIGGFAVAELTPTTPETVKDLGVGRPVGFGPKVYFLATLDDGRHVLAATDPRTYGRLERDIAGGPVSSETVARRKAANTRMGVIFVVAYFLSFSFFACYLTGYIPFLAAFAAGGAAALIGNKLFR